MAGNMHDEAQTPAKTGRDMMPHIKLFTIILVSQTLNKVHLQAAYVLQAIAAFSVISLTHAVKFPALPASPKIWPKNHATIIWADLNAVQANTYAKMHSVVGCVDAHAPWRAVQQASLPNARWDLDFLRK